MTVKFGKSLLGKYRHEKVVVTSLALTVKISIIALKISICFWLIMKESQSAIVMTRLHK